MPIQLYLLLSVFYFYLDLERDELSRSMLFLSGEILVYLFPSILAEGSYFFAYKIVLKTLASSISIYLFSKTNFFIWT